MLQTLARDKHSSLLRIFVNYGRKKFYNIVPRSLLSYPTYRHWRGCELELADDGAQLVETRRRGAVGPDWSVSCSTCFRRHRRARKNKLERLPFSIFFSLHLRLLNISQSPPPTPPPQKAGALLRQQRNKLVRLSSPHQGILTKRKNQYG